MPATGHEILNGVAIGLYVFAALLGSGHALLNKRDPRSAAAWIALCVFFPVGGLVIYLLIGNNRIRTRARRLHALPAEERAAPMPEIAQADAEQLIAREYRNLAFLGRATSDNPLLTGNHVEPLHNGEQAYPAMLAAIRSARRYVHLASYIFDARGVGREFAEALAAAGARGVEVRVLLDGFGEYYSLPRARGMLRRAGVDVQSFLPPRLLPPNFWVNLRNHRKILVVDGEEAFTGGMNIRNKHLGADGAPPRVVDLHFRVRGPVVAQVDAVFRSDWNFSTREALPPPDPAVALRGEAECRVIVDGPNEDRDKLLWVMLGAFALARSSIKLMTPYFLPPREFVVALQTAALRGVEVTVLLPATNNFPFMTWAAMHALPELLRAGVRVALTPGPFVHSKLLLVDDYYAQVGSSNLDPRSLRLNFEMAVEIYDRAIGTRLAEHFEASRARSAPVDAEALRARSLPVRLRDAFFWLFSPYL
jgi:cardiolipin synthase